MTRFSLYFIDRIIAGSFYGYARKQCKVQCPKKSFNIYASLKSIRLFITLSECFHIGFAGKKKKKLNIGYVHTYVRVVRNQEAAKKQKQKKNGKKKEESNLNAGEYRFE